MQLKRSTDILLRVLLYLASHPEREPVSIPDLSEELNWNKNLVVKVAHMAVQEGLLKAARGRSGGLALAKPAKEYNLGQIVRLSEGAEELVSCSEPPCPLLACGCRLRSALRRAEEAFFKDLESYTLADLIGRADGLSVVQPPRSRAA